MKKDNIESSSKITRRRFFKKISIGAVSSGLLVPGLISPKAKSAFADEGNSKIVRISNPFATDESDNKDNTNVFADVVKEMVDTGIKLFTNMPTVAEAWTQIIPDPSKNVAILINLEKTGNFTKHKTISPIIEGLIARGVPSDNIVVCWRGENALSRSGFIKNAGSGIKMGAVSDLGGYTSYEHPELYFEIARLIYEPASPFYCDYIINVPCLKALDGFSGVTLSMKNHYGTCTPDHDDIMNRIPFYNALPEIKDKTRLIVLDAVYCEFEFSWGSQSNTYMSKTNKILFASDPVALDYVGWKMIEAQRIANGKDAVAPRPAFIHNANVNYGLGTDNPDRIEIIDRELNASVTRKTLDKKIYDKKLGSASDEDVKEMIKRYVSGE